MERMWWKRLAENGSREEAAGTWMTRGRTGAHRGGVCKGRAGAGDVAVRAIVTVEGAKSNQRSSAVLR